MVSEEQIRQQHPTARWFDDGFSVDQARHDGTAGEVVTNIQRKPWGFEVWLAYTDKYALKILHVHEGKRLPLQKHDQKQETWLVKKGRPRLVVNNEIVTAEPGMVLHIPTGTIHRITAEDEDVEIWEVSTPELWDVVRLNDDFNRT